MSNFIEDADRVDLYILNDKNPFSEALISKTLKVLLPNVQTRAHFLSTTHFTEIVSFDQQEAIMAHILESWSDCEQPTLFNSWAFYFDQYENFPGVLTQHLLEQIGPDGIVKFGSDNPYGTWRNIMAFIKGPEDIYLFQHESKGKLTRSYESHDSNVTLADSAFGLNKFFIPEGNSKSLSELDEADREKKDPFSKCIIDFAHWYKQDTQ